MSFGSFLRKLSFDAEKSPTTVEGDPSHESSTMNSILNAPGKLLNTVNVKTGSLVSDLNQKLDLSAKLDTLKNASVSTLESVLHGTGAQKDDSPAEKPAAAHENPFNRSEFHSAKSGSAYPEGTGSTQFRRQSSNAGPKPPRPPPPSAASLNRAMSLDEASLSRPAYKPALVAKPLEPSSEVEEEKFHPRQPSLKTVEDEEGDSSASEYGNHGDNPIYKSDEELAPTGGAVPEEATSDATPEHIGFMVEQCVPTIFNVRPIDRESYDSQIHALLGTPAGRVAFVNRIEQEALKTQGRLEPEALPLLLEVLGYFLSRCQETEDFAPARKLLTTSLLFYVIDPSNPTERTFLFAYIKTQPIWQTLRFWNACFFQSLQEARAKAAEQDPAGKTTQEITYDQLQSYLNTMNVFDLHSTIKQEFLRKQSSLFNLTDDEIRSLQSVITE